MVVPAAFVAAMPPSVASAPGSTGKKSPCSPAARSRALRVTPAWTVAAEVVGRDLEDPVEPGEIEADAAALRDDMPLEARAGAERRHGHAQLVREREDARDVVGRGGVDDEIRTPRAVERHVARVEVELRLAVGDAGVRAELAGHRVAKILGRRAQAASLGNPGATLATAQRRLSCTIASAVSSSFRRHACWKDS